MTILDSEQIDLNAARNNRNNMDFFMDLIGGNFWSTSSRVSNVRFRISETCLSVPRVADSTPPQSV